MTEYGVHLYTEVWLQFRYFGVIKCVFIIEAECVSKQTIIGSDNGSSPGQRQAIIWTKAGILLIGPLGSNFSEILIDIYIFSVKKIPFKMSSGKWRQFYLDLNVLTSILYGLMLLLLFSYNTRQFYISRPAQNVRHFSEDSFNSFF